MIRSISAALMAFALGANASADPTSGVDAALHRSSYDANGVFALEGARLLPVRDVSFQLGVGYARAPLVLSVPGIGDAGGDRVLDDLVTVESTFAMTIRDRIAIGIGAAAFRTRTGAGYGQRGRYLGPGGASSTPSTGLIALRPLSNIDPSANPDDASAYLGDGLAGPLDARAALKVALVRRPNVAVAAIASLFLPFGDDEMLLGDRAIVIEPKLALEWRAQVLRVVANTAVRIRRRSVLESYDTMAPNASIADAAVIFDLGSELVVGVGAVYELAPRVALAGELQLFTPLPDAFAYGRCRRFNGTRCPSGDGDATVLGAAGLKLRVSNDVSAAVMVGAGALGARSDALRITTGLTWAPQPTAASGAIGRDRDSDGVIDTVDACRDEAEDRDGFHDEDGCPEPDNDGDGIVDTIDQCRDDAEDRDGFRDDDGCPERDNDDDGVFDAADRCPDRGEDRDGFEDEDGCPEDDNDGDGIADARDRCPNDRETINGIDDDDGCPDARVASGPEERPDRIDLRGARIAFARGATLPAASQRVLDQVATLIKARRLTIRVEVHVALGTRATAPAQVAAQKRRDRLTSQQRAKAILDYLLAQGVPLAQIQAVGLGADRPLGTSSPSDAGNERVDFIKAQQ